MSGDMDTPTLDDSVAILSKLEVPWVTEKKSKPFLTENCMSRGFNISVGRSLNF